GAMGIGISQLVTDFGRTSSLTQSAKLRAAAQEQNTATTKTQVLVQVEQAYYSLLAADAVLQVARARVEMQRLTLRQVQALAASSLKIDSRREFCRSRRIRGRVGSVSSRKLRQSRSRAPLRRDRRRKGQPVCNR